MPLSPTRSSFPFIPSNTWSTSLRPERLTFSSRGAVPTPNSVLFRAPPPNASQAHPTTPKRSAPHPIRYVPVMLTTTQPEPNILQAAPPPQLTPFVSPVLQAAPPQSHTDPRTHFSIRASNPVSGFTHVGIQKDLATQIGSSPSISQDPVVSSQIPPQRAWASLLPIIWASNPLVFIFPIFFHFPFEPYLTLP
jgi:hypothetical protein